MQVITMPVGFLATNCYLVLTERNGAVVIDPGADPEGIMQRLEQQGAKLRMILLTHGHFDHIGAVAALHQETGAPVYISQGDADMLRDPDPYAAEFVRPGTVSPCEPSRTVVEGESIPCDELRFEVIETPGHTPGGVVYRCGDLLFTGDTLFRDSIGRTDFEGGSYSEILDSLRKLAALDGDYRVFPGHGPATTLEHERESNPFMKTGEDYDASY